MPLKWRGPLSDGAFGCPFLNPSPQYSPESSSCIVLRLMPISCHFRDCKALLVACLTHVSDAIASVQTFTFTFTNSKTLLFPMTASTVCYSANNYCCSFFLCHFATKSNCTDDVIELKWHTSLSSCEIVHCIYIVGLSVSLERWAIEFVVDEVEELCDKTSNRSSPVSCILSVNLSQPFKSTYDQIPLHAMLNSNLQDR